MTNEEIRVGHRDGRPPRRRHRKFLYDRRTRSGKDSCAEKKARNSIRRVWGIMGQSEKPASAPGKEQVSAPSTCIGSRGDMGILKGNGGTAIFEAG